MKLITVIAVVKVHILVKGITFGKRYSFIFLFLKWKQQRFMYKSHNQCAMLGKSIKPVTAQPLVFKTHLTRFFMKD